MYPCPLAALRPTKSEAQRGGLPNSPASTPPGSLGEGEKTGLAMWALLLMIDLWLLDLMLKPLGLLTEKTLDRPIPQDEAPQEALEGGSSGKGRGVCDPEVGRLKLGAATFLYQCSFWNPQIHSPSGQSSRRSSFAPGGGNAEESSSSSSSEEPQTTFGPLVFWGGLGGGPKLFHPTIIHPTTYCWLVGGLLQPCWFLGGVGGVGLGHLKKRMVARLLAFWHLNGRELVSWACATFAITAAD